MQKILRYAWGIVLFTINRYFTSFEAVNLEQKLTVQQSLNGTSTTHIFAWLHTLVKSCLAGLCPTIWRMTIGKSRCKPMRNLAKIQMSPKHVLSPPPPPCRCCYFQKPSVVHSSLYKCNCVCAGNINIAKNCNLVNTYRYWVAMSTSVAWTSAILMTSKLLIC